MLTVRLLCDIWSQTFNAGVLKLMAVWPGAFLWSREIMATLKAVCAGAGYPERKLSLLLEVRKDRIRTCAQKGLGEAWLVSW